MREYEVYEVLQRLKKESKTFSLSEDTLNHLLASPNNFSIVIELIKTKKFDIDCHEGLDVVVPLGVFECLRRLVI